MAQLTKIDSNVTGLRYAEEASYKVLPSGNAKPADWIPLEPNTYADFGGQITTIARNPINPSRQRKKGVVTDLDASGGFDTDVTQENLQDVLQGYFFADLRRKPETRQTQITYAGQYVPISDAETATDTMTIDNVTAESAVVVAGGTTYAVDDVVTVTVGAGAGTIDATFVVTGETGGVVDTVDVVNPGRYSIIPPSPAATTGAGDDGLTLTLTSGTVTTFLADTLVFASGFTNAGNNGLKTLTTVAGTGDITLTFVENLVDETPTAAAALTTVGVEGSADDIDVVVSGSLPALVSSTLDWTTLGLIPGEWIFVGGDAVGTKFATAVNNGLKRIRSITATTLTLDKSDSTMEAEVSSSIDLQVFYGRVLKNELGTDIIRRTYQLERTLGAPDDAAPAEVQAEYITGSVPGEFTLNIPTAEKVTASLSFVGADNETIDGPTALKTGTRPSLVEADAFNTSSDFSRIKMAEVVAGDEAPTALFAFVTDLTVGINNNLTPNKAIGVLGSFEVTSGTFAVSGDVTAYFADVAAVQAVRDNIDITLDSHMIKANSGITWDIPLITLGDGRPNVEQDQAITLPLSMDAATAAKVDSALDYTLMAIFWDYLPDAADT